jgi:hypothetical protein
MTKIHCLDPIHNPDIVTRDVFFGAKDETRVLPSITEPLHIRKQEDQGFTNKCTIYAVAELIENKAYASTGRWYKFTEDLIDSTWEDMKKRGLAWDDKGAYLNAPLEVLQNEIIPLIDTVSGDTIFVRINPYFYIYKSGVSVETFIKNFKMSDVGNFEKPISDIVVKSGLIEDDRFITEIVLKKYPIILYYRLI